MTHQIKIPTIVNGIPNFYGEFRSTTFKNEETLTDKCQQVKTTKTQIVKSSNLVKHKVLIIGDSHTRKCVSLVQENLDIDYRVSSFVKPGAQMNDITKSAKEEVKSLKSEDLVVIWGGANDISRNNTKKALKLMSEFVNENNELNIVIINSPYRHDLDFESCVNQEVTKFNRQLKKIMKLQSKVKVLELNLDRSHFTTHGLHMNSKGKELVSQKLALMVQHILTH
jgi:lysophospholipase L1-like esterase